MISYPWEGWVRKTFKEKQDDHGIMGTLNCKEYTQKNLTFEARNV